MNAAVQGPPSKNAGAGYGPHIIEGHSSSNPCCIAAPAPAVARGARWHPNAQELPRGAGGPSDELHSFFFPLFFFASSAMNSQFMGEDIFSPSNLSERKESLVAQIRSLCVG